MTDPSILPPGGRLMPSSRQYRATSQSPTRQRQVPDDLLSHLSPMNAVEAFRSPTGSLKTCIDAAAATEQSFAIRVAVASQNIYEWLDELREWPWPSEGGGLGFQAPAPKRRRLASRGREGSTVEDAPEEAPVSEDGPYMGSLPAADVSRYEERVEQIQQGLEELDIEDIKAHVLHNHILPLSRPGTPMSPTFDRRASMPTISSFVKMDDLSAVVTAIIVQALPNLSKLIRLLNTWSIRLAISRRVPGMLSSLAGAEAAVQSGWSTVERVQAQLDEIAAGKLGGGQTLSRSEFEVMKLVLENKVSEAGRNLDYMLDTLEGREDTLPDDWCDRMDVLEREYSEWITSCERILWESEFAMPRVPTKAIDSTGDSAQANSQPRANGDRTNIKPEEKRAENGAPSTAELAKASDHPSTGLEESNGDVPTEAVNGDNVSKLNHRDSPDSKLSGQEHDGKNALFIGEHNAESSSPNNEASDVSSESSTSSIINLCRKSQEIMNVTGDNEPSDLGFDVADEFSMLEPSPMEREPSLPPFPEEPNRPGTAGSETSTIVHAKSSKYVKSSGLPRIQGIESSPPFTPPRERERSCSISPNGMPTVPEYQDDDDGNLSKTPLESSFVEDNSYSQDLGSSFVLSEAGEPGVEDEHLQHQISEILGNIPAKIHLSSQPARVNHLNPPGLNLPHTQAKPMADRQPIRSYSSMSNRAATPSFMLAPVPRPRHQRGNPAIKLYHLSRSTGEAPIKLFIRCVGENGERVMVRVGGGWADLGEYLKEYISHHRRRSNAGSESKVEIRDLPRTSSSPPSRPASEVDSTSPLQVRKVRKSPGPEELLGPKLPRTPGVQSGRSSEPPSSGSGESRSVEGRSRSNSRLSWTDEDSSLGMAGPRSKMKDIPEESKAWVESIKEKVRIASGDMSKTPDRADGKFGELGKIGGTTRLFKKGQGQK